MLGNVNIVTKWIVSNVSTNNANFFNRLLRNITIYYQYYSYNLYLVLFIEVDIETTSYIAGYHLLVLFPIRLKTLFLIIIWQSFDLGIFSSNSIILPAFAIHPSNRQTRIKHLYKLSVPSSFQHSSFPPILIDQEGAG